MPKQRIVRTVNTLLRPLGVELVRANIFREPVFDPASSSMNDAALQARLIEQLGRIARACLVDGVGIPGAETIDYGAEIRRFMQIYVDRPDRENTGGSGFHNAFWLFLLARAIEPRLIVESGVWKGRTTWLLEQACSAADVHGFDIDLSRLRYPGGKAQFHEHDWSEYRFEEVDSDRALAFFDCHVNHARRIIEAHARGFRHLVFDDNPPAHTLYAYGVPGFPTATMVWEGMRVEARRIAWRWQGRDVSYEIDPAEVDQARALMQSHVVLPDVGGFTRYGGFSFLTYVGLG